MILLFKTPLMFIAQAQPLFFYQEKKVNFVFPARFIFTFPLRSFFLQLTFVFFSACLLLLAPPFISASEMAEISAWMQFERLSIKDGLSQSSANCFLQDRLGFLWIGTEDGLNRYDGLRFKVFRPREGDENSLSDGYILCMHEDHHGNLWVGTMSGGLNFYDRQQDKFIRYLYRPEPDSSLPDNLFPFNIQVISEDTEGDLWLGTTAGLIQFDPHRRTYKLFQHNPREPSGLSHNSILSLARDNRGHLWIGTQKGLNVLNLTSGEFNPPIFDNRIYDLFAQQTIRCLYLDSAECLWIGTDRNLACFDFKTREITFFVPQADDPNSLKSGYIRCIWEDKQHLLWIGTFGGGLNLYDRQEKKFYHVLNRPEDESSLPNNYINCILEDRTGIIWIGTFGGGIAKYCEPIKKKFIHINQSARGGLSLSANIVFAILEDRQGQLWVGTYGGGLDCLDRKKRTRVNYRHQAGNPYSLGSDNIRCLLEDKAGFIWIGTYEGLERFDLQRKIFTHFRHDPDDPGSLSHNYVRALLEDEQGFIWVGTLGGGLDCYNPQTGTFQHYRHQTAYPQTLSDNRVTSLLLDQEGYLWVGTSYGLNRLDRDSGKVIRFLAKANNPDSLSNNRILCLYQDAQGRLWIGTYGGGLNLFDQDTNKFRVFKQKDGLPNNVVYGIVEDNQGRLWISTNQGLCCFDPDRMKFRNYDVSDGLQSNEFNSKAVFKNKKGEIFFGGVNGLNIFHPESMPLNQHQPSVVLTGLRVLYQPVSLNTENNEDILSTAIEVAHQITLSPHHRVVTFEFAALDFVAPGKNRYAFKLEGFDEDWNYVGSQASATYTNLPPGDYVFRVKAANNDNIWNEEGLSLKVRMNPFYWQTWWFKVLLGLAVVTLGVVVHLIRVQAIREKKQELEKINIQLEEEVRSRNQAEKELKKLTNELEKRVVQRTQDLLEAKERLEREVIERKKISAELQSSLEEKEVLLQEIHHRIKNNLQIVSSLINLQMKKFSDNQVQEAFKMCLGRLRTMAFVHEELYQQKLFTAIDFREYTLKLIDHLKRLYSDKYHHVEIKLTMERTYLDITKAIPCALILNELLTNCFKHAFPPDKRPEGIIEVSVKKKKKKQCQLLVVDNGVGFSQEIELEKPSSLGLRIIYSLVRQLGGEIKIDSGPQGTQVYINF